MNPWSIVPPPGQAQAACFLLGSYVTLMAGVGWLALAVGGYCEAGATLVDELRRRRHD